MNLVNKYKQALWNKFYKEACDDAYETFIFCGIQRTDEYVKNKAAEKLLKHYMPR